MSIAGLVVARWTLAAIASLLPQEATSALQFDLHLDVVLFGMVLALGTILLFGLFPALHSTRPDLVSAIKAQAGQPSGTRAAAGFRTTLVTAQIALSRALLVAAGLFVKSLVNVSRVSLGVGIDHLVTFGISSSLNGYEPPRTMALMARTEEELAAIPGVTAVAAASVPLLAGNNWGNSVSVEGFRRGPDTNAGSRYNQVSAGHFRTLGVPLLAGREFTAADAAASPKVAIVNEAFVRKFQLGREAVGKHLGTGEINELKLDTEIVGVVPDTKYSDVKQEPPPLFFRPYRQAEIGVGSLTFYVRTAGDPGVLLRSLPGVMARLDPTLPVEDLKTMTQQVRENVFMDRMISTLAAAFAVLATLLAAIGLYGVLAYTVSQRTREIGLRMALGADGPRVRRMILAQVGWMTLVGAVLGLAGALLLGRGAEALLFELKGYDPLVFIVSLVLLALTAFGAGCVPAWRASRVHPMQALRYE